MFQGETKVSGQRIFEAVLEHLAEQKHQSLDDAGENCQYRGVGGNMCAVGALIDDEDYRSEWDDRMNPFGITKLLQAIESGVYGDHLKWMLGHEQLLGDLQFLHDIVDNWESKQAMLDAAMTVASRYRLDTSRVSELVHEIFN
jgi:hypothetical protein